MPIRPSFIAHRLNTVSQMLALPDGLGAELDVRSYFDSDGTLRLHSAHDPLPRGEPTDELLQAFGRHQRRGTLVVNTKEDGLEPLLMAKLAQYGITNYFFLDTALPTLRTYTDQGLGAHFAGRLSDCESVSYWAQKPPACRPKWLWVDCFGGKPVPAVSLAPLMGGFLFCIVSPELHLKADAAQIEEGLRRIPRFRALAAYADAICTKRPDLWN